MWPFKDAARCGLLASLPKVWPACRHSMTAFLCKYRKSTSSQQSAKRFRITSLSAFVGKTTISPVNTKCYQCVLKHIRDIKCETCIVITSEQNKIKMYMHGYTNSFEARIGECTHFLLCIKNISLLNFLARTRL